MIEAQSPGQGKEPDGSRFRRHSIFEQATAESTAPKTPRSEVPEWLDEARMGIDERGQYLAFDDDGETTVVPIKDGWTRIGRSRTATLRLDDATVSRRHALVVNNDERGLRVLDDRSLNGVYLNGKRVDWGALQDGDELQVGRFRLFVIDSALVEAAS